MVFLVLRSAIERRAQALESRQRTKTNGERLSRESPRETRLPADC